jgi:hypothetical protein
MEPITINNLHESAKETVKDLFKTEVLAATQNDLKHAFRTMFEINDEQLQDLQSYFPTRYVLKNVSKTPKPTPHPILASLNQFSDEDAARTITHLHSNGYKTISIGDSIKPKVYAQHNCVLLNNSRDQYRAKNTAFTSPSANMINYARYNDARSFCSIGAHKCQHSADVAFFMHSMYDISPTEVAQIFDKHSLTKAISYIHIPRSFYHPTLAKLDERIYGTLHDGNKILFNMRDLSFAYAHDFDNWKTWANTTQISYTNNTCITIEIFNRHGPLNIMNLVVTTFKPPTPRIIPLDIYCEDHCLVPDITVALRRSLCKHQNDIPHILVPNHVVNHIMSYVSRVADESYKFTEVAALASGLLRSVKIGSIIYTRKWDVNADEYHRVLLSLFILGAINRRDRTTTISECFNHMKKWRNDIFVLFRQIGCNIIDALQHPFLTPTTGETPAENINSWYLWHYHIRYFKPTTTSLEHKISSPYNQITQGVEDEVYLDGTVDEPEDFADYPDDDSNSTTSSMDINTIEDSLNTQDESITQPILNKSTAYDVTAPVYQINDVTYTSTDDDIPTTAKLDLTNCHMAYERDYIITTDPTNPDNVLHIHRINNAIVSNDNANMLIAIAKMKPAIYTYNTINIIKNIQHMLNIPEVEEITFNNIEEKYPNMIACIPAIEPQQLTEELIACTHPLDVPLNEYFKLNTPDSNILNINEPTPTKKSNPERKRVTFKDFKDHLRVGSLRSGLCMMQSFAEAADIHSDPSGYIRTMYDYIDTYTFNHHNIRYGPSSKVDYFYNGNQDSPVAIHILPALCEYYNVRLLVDGVTPVLIGPELGRPATIFCTKVSSNRYHYTSYPSGGAADKFPQLLDRFLADGQSFFEVSCAPGMCLSYITTAPKYANVKATGGHYSIGLSMMNPPPKARIIPYQSYAQLPDLIPETFDVVFCDAANRVNSEAITNAIVPHLPQFVSVNGILVVKTFTNPHCVWKIAVNFETIETYETNVGQECYYILRNYTPAIEYPENEYLKAYARFHSPITQHRMMLKMDDVKAFAKEFFSEIKVGSDKPRLTGKNRTYNIRACTGVAGSAKTTQLANLLKDEKVCFISPSNQLSIHHTTNFATPSFTPHIALNNLHNYTHVIIDEISMFDVRYVAMIAATFHNIEIYVAGDKHQIPPFADGYAPQTVFDFGVSNNLIYTYAVPNDICKSIREVMKIPIYPKLDRPDGLCTYLGRIEQLIDFPFICLNSDSCEDLKKKGFKVHTISTYQGSREPVVVFYVDAKAVQSKIINQPEYIYTALTRGTSKIVVYGETQYISKYLRINGLVARTYEEISDIRPITDTVLNEPDDEDNSFQYNPTTVFDEKVAKEQAHPQPTIDILKENITPINPPDNPYNHDPNIPAVVTGSLTVKPFNLQPPQKEFRGFVFDKSTKFVKSQVSDDPTVTIDTMVKRYTKRTQKIKPTACRNITDAMEAGLAKACTGSNHNLHIFRLMLKCTPDELRNEYVKYIERLNKKMIGGATSTILNQINSPFDEYNEVMEFINKRQAKYDPEPGFDSKTKAGQGIASMSKRVNLLFAAYACLLLDKCRTIAARFKQRILFATHGSDDEISLQFAALESGTLDCKYVCNDISEWDASFCKPMSDLTARLCGYLGCPKPLIDWFVAYRADWFMVNRNKLHNIALYGKSKQFSGSPFTIAENTLCNAAIMFATFDFKDLQYSAYKGDDMLSKCRDATITTFGEKLFKTTKHKLKVFHTMHGEFAGFIVSRDGCFPDLLRKAAKFFGKVYRNNEHFQEAQKSAFACTSSVHTERHLVEGLAKSAFHYAEILKDANITVGQLRVIFHTLKQCHQFRFAELQPTTLRPLQINQ